MWYDLKMAHKLTNGRCTLAVGARGRLVLPSDVRKRLSLAEGDRFLLEVRRDGRVVLTPLAVVARRARGMFRHLAPGRVLSEELIAGRRAEAAREARK